MITENYTEAMTDEEWAVAHAIAKFLVENKADVNELKKAIGYFQVIVEQPNADSKIFTYLQKLVRYGNRIGHSEQTLNYYLSIEKACHNHLKNCQMNAHTMLLILGWASRLMYYYKVTPVGKADDSSKIPKILNPPIKSGRQKDIARATEKINFQIGQHYDAKVTKIKGNEVTYEILDTIRLTIKEPKKFKDLSEGQFVQVEITEIKDNGSPKKIKMVDQTLLSA